MDDLVERLRARAEFEDARVLKEVMRDGFEPVAYTGSESGRMLREAADALEAAREDAERYRWLADNRCDVTMCASATDYGDGDTTFGPRVEIDPEQFGPEYGSPKAKLDAAIDAALSQQRAVPDDRPRTKDELIAGLGGPAYFSPEQEK